MKNGLIFTLLLTILLVSCQKDTDIGPADLLYQRWHLDRVRGVNDNFWILYDTDGYYDTEYRRDGTLIHRKDGVIKPASCCEARLYERSGIIIQYSDFVTCPTVFCAPAQKTTITLLSDNLLELQDGQRIAQYTSVK